MDSKTNHLFHVWINSEATRFREYGVAEKPHHGFDPHERGLYDFKSAMQLLEYLPKQITRERTKSLPLVHQQYLHSAPEPIPENHLTCWLGERLDACPILKRLRASFDEYRLKHPYYASVTDEQVDGVAAQVCVWHLLMGQPGFVDWQEGAVQTTSDRMFWDRLYRNLADVPPDQPEADD